MGLTVMSVNMADIVKQRAATPKVALPKFPPGKAANWGAKPKGTSTPPSSGQQTPRSEEQPKPKPQQPVDLTALQVDARYVEGNAKDGTIRLLVTEFRSPIPSPRPSSAPSTLATPT